MIAKAKYKYSKVTTKQTYSSCNVTTSQVHLYSLRNKSNSTTAYCKVLEFSPIFHLNYDACLHQISQNYPRTKRNYEQIRVTSQQP